MNLEKDHRFLDEAGDTTFFGKGRALVLDQEGVSKAFILGMVKFKGSLNPYREAVRSLADQVAADPYFQDVPSIQKRLAKGGFFFHAKDDLPEVRMLFFKLQMKTPLVLNIAERGASTRQKVLDDALDKASRRFQARQPGKEVCAQVRFNVQTPRTEPLLAVSDYLCWAVQRVFERGDLRPYRFIQEKVSLVVDLYDREKWGEGSRNYYTQRKPLTEANQLPKHSGPPPP